MSAFVPTPEFLEALETAGVVAELRALRLWHESHEAPKPRICADDLWHFCRSFRRMPPVSLKECLKVAQRLRTAADAFDSFEEPFGIESRASMNVAMHVDVAMPPNEIELTLGRPYHSKTLKRAGSVPSVLRGLADTVEQMGRHRTSPKGPRANVDEKLFRVRWEHFAMKMTGKPLDEIGVLLLGIVFGKTIEKDSYSKERTTERKSRDQSRDKKPRNS